MALFYGVAGILHLLVPMPFVAIVPHAVPAADAIVAFTGIAEICGAIGLVQSRWPRLRRMAGYGLALYALCVWPANVQHMLMDMERPDSGLGLIYHIPRLAAQPIVIWLALWTGGITRWPLRRC